MVHKTLNDESNSWSVCTLCSANSICSICYDLYNEKVLCMYLWMSSWIIVGLPTPLLTYYLVASYVCWG